MYLLTNVIFGQVEQHLTQAGTGYLVLESVSVADLAVFHEMVNVTRIAKVQPDNDQFPRMVNWMHSMSGIAEVQTGIEKFMNEFERLDEEQKAEQ